MSRPDASATLCEIAPKTDPPGAVPGRGQRPNLARLPRLPALGVVGGDSGDSPRVQGFAFTSGEDRLQPTSTVTPTTFSTPETVQRIAVDLDGVLTEHPRPLAQAASARFGMELPESAFIDSAGLNVPIEVRDWVYSDTGPASALRPAPGATEFLDRVIDLFGLENVIIVTARPETSAPMTMGWLHQYGFSDCQVIYADFKAAIALQQRCAFAVEDSLRHARNYVAAGVTCYLLAGSDAQPAAHERGIVRVTDLTSLARLLSAERRSNQMDGADPSHRSGDVAPSKNESNERPTIVISDAIHPAARARLAANATLIDVDGTNVSALITSVAEADALVVRSETNVTEAVFAAAPRLRVVARAGVGVDNIELEAATRAGVVVLNAPGANAVSACEHTIALLLAITRQIPDANQSTHAGRWERKRFKPVDLRGRTAGIVGLGRVGSLVAQRLRAFEMKVLAYDPYIAPRRFTEIGAAPVDLTTLLSTSDIISFHVPVTPETTHMLNATTIAKLKPGAIVLNVARGEVVDEPALADALRSGHVAAAGVDVFPHEPCTESPLFGLPTAVLTPHIGGSSAEALAAVGDVISTTTLAALRGEAIPNAVNMPGSSVQAPELQRLTQVAGAAGHLLANLQPALPETFTLTVNGLIPADVVEHVTLATLSEALRRWTDGRITAVNARLVAQEVGLTVRTVVGDTDPDRLPDISVEAGEPSHHVRVSWDRANAAIMEVDRFGLERPLAGDVLITHHHDQPGVIGRMGTILGNYQVNIAGMQVGRHERGGEALMVTNVDDVIPAEALAELEAIPGIGRVFVVSLPPASSTVVQASMLARLTP